MAENALRWERTHKVLKEYATAVVQRYRTKLPKASGKLKQSIKSEVVIDGKTMEVVLHLEDYWYYVEHGRRPKNKFPPVDAIREWIEVKPIVPRPMANGKLPTVEQLAYLIGRKIAEDGIEARPYLQESIDEAIEHMEERLQEAIEQDVGAWVETEIKTALGALNE